MTKGKTRGNVSSKELAVALLKNLSTKGKKEVKSKPLSKEELDKILATLLKKKTKKKVTRIVEEKSIEEKVSEKAIREAQLQAVEATDFWKEHQKHHKGAKLELLSGHRPSSDSLRQSLGGSDLGYTTGSPETIQGSVYGAQEQLALGGGGSYLGANDPNRPGFWATCNCGMTIEVESTHTGSPPTIKSYGVAETSGSGPLYGATFTGGTYSTEKSAVTYK